MVFEPFFLVNEADVQTDCPYTVTLPSGREIVLFNIDGSIHALDNACPHMGGPLSEGDVDNGCVTCPWHGWQFNVKNGSNTTGLGDDATKVSILIKDGKIYLNEPL